MKEVAGGRENPGKSNSTDLKILEQFNNPYVKVCVLCKVCNKEQSLKYTHTWKRHFLTHSSEDARPHRCTSCGKTFVQSGNLKKHFQSVHKHEVTGNLIASSPACPIKSEMMLMSD